MAFSAGFDRFPVSVMSWPATYFVPGVIEKFVNVLIGSDDLVEPDWQKQAGPTRTN